MCLRYFSYKDLEISQMSVSERSHNSKDLKNVINWSPSLQLKVNIIEDFNMNWSISHHIYPNSDYIKSTVLSLCRAIMYFNNCLICFGFYLFIIRNFRTNIWVDTQMKPNWELQIFWAMKGKPQSNTNFL